MMKLIFLYLIFLFSETLVAQNIKSIAIIHRGDELKPVGTLLISLGVRQLPNERGLIDTLYGQGVKTDAKTFFFLENYFKRNKLLIDNAENLSDSSEFYAFKFSNGFKLYLGVLDFRSFFNSLRSTLKKRGLDAKVIKALRYY